MQEIRLLLTAVQYFTRVPMPRWVGHEGAQLSGTTRYFPAIGIAVGAVGGGVFWLAAMVFPAVVAVILSVIATVALTGALHEDGLADTMDGLGGGHTRERALEIMKDPRIGAFGAIALMLALALKIAALTAIPASSATAASGALSAVGVIAMLIAGHALSRWCAVLLIWRLPYARTDSATRARPVVERVGGADIGIATLFGLAPLFACIAVGLMASMAGDGVSALPTAPLAASSAAAAALATTALLGAWYKRRLGGYTGDTLGATQQITEIVFYLAILAAWNSR